MQRTSLFRTRSLGVAIGIAAAALLFSIIVKLNGNNPFAVLYELAISGWSSKNAISESIVKALPILFCAMATAVPGKLGLINVGGEGQMTMGAIGSTWAFLLFSEYPKPLVLFMMALFGILFGVLWGSIPGLLRAYARSSETVISLLMNYVASLILLHLIHGAWRDPNALGWPQTEAFGNKGMLPYLFAGTRIHVLIIAGIAVCALTALFFKFSVYRLAFRVIQVSPECARYLKMRVGMYYLFAFLFAGMLAGLSGFGEVAGIHGRLREGIAMGYGYSGFLVAWLCQNRIALLPLASLLLGGMLAGADSLQISSGLPFATVNILQGLVLLAVLISESSIMDSVETLKKKAKA